MLSMYDENNIQALAAIKAVTGHDMRLLPMDEIMSIRPTEEGIDVWVVTYQWDDRKSEIRVTGRGLALHRFTEQVSGRWNVWKSTVWDVAQCEEGMAGAIRSLDMERAQHWMTLQSELEKLGDFTPFNIPHHGPRQTASEWAARVKRERMAYRTGTASHPMDNWERTKEGYTTERMTKHWKRG